ncbi:MAG: metal-sensitive transcriptional regulator, partial [Thermodesulfobacteriota bacterium]
MEIERQKRDVLMRLRRIEGQLRGIQRMVEEGVPCPEILTQIAA